MSAEQMGQRKRTPRKPKARSQRRRGGDRVSVKAKTAQMARDAEAFRMRAQGFSFATIATFLGVGEEACRLGYWRAVRSQSLATIEESRALALSDIDQRRAIIWTEIRKAQAALGTDGRKRFDVGELRGLMDALHQCAVRQARLQGLDAPSRLGIAWMGDTLGGDTLGGDTLTNEMLDRLNDNELRSLWTLMEKARTATGAIETTSRAVADTLNFQPAAPAPTEPKAAAPVAEPPAPAPTVSEPTLVPNLALEESPNRYARLEKAEEIVRQLLNQDPVTRIGDQSIRAKMRREANQILIRFGRTPLGED
jgi:hypothetical protein